MNSIRLNKIAISTFDLFDPDFQVQLHSLISHEVAPDFIILHYSGFFFSLIKYYRYILKTIRQYRFRSIKHIINRKAKPNKHRIEKFLLQQKDLEIVNSFINSTVIIKVKGINDLSTIKKIRNLGKSIIVSNSGILKNQILNLPETIFLNIHTSRLPQYRGMNNVEWALFEGSDIYVTVHKISRGIDEGDILYQQKIEIEEENLSNIADYRNYFFNKSFQIIGFAIQKYLKGEIDFEIQKDKGRPISQYYTMHPLLKSMLLKRIKCK